MQEIDNIVPNIYKSEQAADEVRSRYKECLRLWPVPSEQLYIPTSQGKTFVLASGPENVPPVVLLHGTMSKLFCFEGTRYYFMKCEKNDNDTFILSPYLLVKEK